MAETPVVILESVFKEPDSQSELYKRVRKLFFISGASSLIVETVLGPGPEAPFKNFLDLNMLVMTGGRERTEAGYKALLEKAGFTLSRVIPTASPMSIVEGILS